MQITVTTNPVYNGDDPSGWAGQQNWYEGSPFQGVNSGNYHDLVVDPVFRGRYWSSTAYSGGNAYDLDFDSGSVGPGNIDYDKRIGFAVRAVL